MTDKILTEAYAKLTAIEESGTSDYASQHRKMQRAFADLKDEMTDKLQGLTDKLLRKMKLTDDGYSWGSASRPYKRGQGFMLSTRVGGDARNIEAFVNRLNKEMAKDVDTIVVGSMYDTELPAVAWLHAKFPNKYARVTAIEESGESVTEEDDSPQLCPDCLASGEQIHPAKWGVETHQCATCNGTGIQSTKTKSIREEVDGDNDDVADGIEEFTGIQDELFELIERLDSAIRAYAPDKHRYWQAYGIAQLKVIAGSDEYASNDESITKLIQNLHDELENDRDQNNERPERGPRGRR